MDIGALVERLTDFGVPVKDASEIIAQAYGAGVASAPSRDRDRKRKPVQMTIEGVLPEKPPKASRIPPDFKPDIEFALSLGIPRHRALREVDAFRDFWSGVPGKDGIKSDWPATWRNRCRKVAEYIGAVPPAKAEAVAIVDPKKMTPEQWKPILAIYERTSNWNPVYGPEPGLPGSMAPQRGML